VTVQYSDDGTPERIDTIVVSTQHDEFDDDDERMLATKRGREYARQIPLDRLLLETDAPTEENEDTTAQSLVESLTSVSKSIATLKNCDARRIESVVLANSRSIFDFR